MEEPNQSERIIFTMHHAHVNDDELTLRILRNFRVISGLVHRHFREIELTFGITASQLSILKEVSNQPGIGILGLAEKLSIHRSTCSLQVDGLVSRLLLKKKRSLGDRRRIGVSVSEKGERIMRELSKPRERLLPKALSEMPIAEIVALDKSVEILIERFMRIRRPPLIERAIRISISNGPGNGDTPSR